jgi:hypothetical protein
MRKTGYCIAIFGKANRDDLKGSARHSKKSRSAPVYEKDAAASVETHERHQTDGNMVRKWTNIKVESVRNQKTMCKEAGSEHRPINDLPDHFVHNILKVERDNPNRRDIRFLLDRAAVYVKGTEAKQQLNDFMLGMSQDRKDELWEIFEQLYIERRRRETYAAALAEEQQAAAAEESPAVAPAPLPRIQEEPEPVEDDTTENRPRREGNNNLDERKDLQLMTPKQRLETFVRWNAEKHANGPYTKAANDFFKKSVFPIVRCLTNHFNGDMDAFLSKYPNMAYSKFNEKCCKGWGSGPCSTATNNNNNTEQQV